MLQTAIRSFFSVQQELRYRPLAGLASALIQRSEFPVAFLDSSAEPAPDARWSILGWRPKQVVTWPQGRPGAFEALRALLSERQVEATTDDQSTGAPLPFHGGWLGWFAYDLGRHIERLPATATADPTVPDFALAECDAALLEDRVEGRLFAVASAETSEAARNRCESIVAEAADLKPAPQVGFGGPIASTLSERITREDYLGHVARILHYIEMGDIYQANFSYRVDAEVRAGAAQLYHRLRLASPAPYGCFLRLPGAPELLSISPELFLQRRGAQIETRPIKGTRPRSDDPARDSQLRDELWQDAKERAELLMIVDLERNDLGRVARVGSVAVPDLRSLVTHPTVHHAAATVTAELAPNVDVASLLGATLPGGSVTGAPKIRAMEILEELEGDRRGPYTGCAGYIDYNGNLALNILIRTIVREGRRAHFHVGSAIVADSDPAAEYDETRAKAAAMLHALTATDF